MFSVVANLMNTVNLWSSNAHFVFVFLSKRKNFTNYLPMARLLILREIFLFVCLLFHLKISPLFHPKDDKSLFNIRFKSPPSHPTNTLCFVSFFILAKGRPPPPPLPVRVHIPFRTIACCFVENRMSALKAATKQQAQYKMAGMHGCTTVPHVLHAAQLPARSRWLTKRARATHVPLDCPCHD